MDSKFKVGDRVVDSMCNLRGVVTKVEALADGHPFYSLLMDNGKVDYHTQFLTPEPRASTPIAPTAQYSIENDRSVRQWRNVNGYAQALMKGEAPIKVQP